MENKNSRQSSSQLNEYGQQVNQITTLKASPWELIGSGLSWVDRLRFGKGILKTMLNPERTEGIFESLDLMLKKEGPGSPLTKFARETVDRHEETKKACEERYLEPKPDVEKLLQLPEGTLGREYAAFLSKHDLEPVFYPAIPVDTESKWINMRGRQLHDVFHVLTGFGTSVPEELGLQAFTLGQAAVPVSSMIVGGGLMFAGMKQPWIIPDCMFAIERGFRLGLISTGPVMGLRYSDYWEHSLEDVREILGIPADAQPHGLSKDLRDAS